MSDRQYISNMPHGWRVNTHKFRPSFFFHTRRHLIKASNLCLRTIHTQGTSLKKRVFQILRDTFWGRPHDKQPLLERDIAAALSNLHARGKWRTRQFSRQTSIQRLVGAYTSAQAYPFVRFGVVNVNLILLKRILHVLRQLSSGIGGILGRVIWIALLACKVFLFEDFLRPCHCARPFCLKRDPYCDA